jgi:hypothetical protein
LGTEKALEAHSVLFLPFFLIFISYLDLYTRTFFALTPTCDAHSNDEEKNKKKNKNQFLP